MLAGIACLASVRGARLALVVGCLSVVAGCGHESADPSVAHVEVQLSVAGAPAAVLDEEQLIREAERRLHEALAGWQRGTPGELLAVERPDLQHVNAAEYGSALLEYSLSSPVVVDVETDRDVYVGVQFYVTARLRSHDTGTSSERRFAYRVYQVSPRRWIAGGWTL